MSAAGFGIAIRAVPFLDLLDSEEDMLASEVLEAVDPTAVASAMDASRRRLAQGVDAFVRSLPTAIRNDVSTSRAAAYALVGLADERMLHHPAGGLDRWRERLLEFELYGSALAGQEVVTRARAAAYGAVEEAGGAQGQGLAEGEGLLAAFYLGVIRAGFEGSLRGDSLALASLTASLEEAVSANRYLPLEPAADVRPTRIGLSPLPLAGVGLGVWLLSGLGTWLALTGASLDRAERIAERISGGLSITLDASDDPLDRGAGPSGLPPFDAESESRGSR